MAARPPSPPGPLAEAVAEALALLEDHAAEVRGAGATLPALVEPLPSLLDRCETLLAEAEGPAPVRTLHHLACTGGTLICKCLAALPNTVLLSEVDPLAGLGGNGVQRPAFAPTDLIRQMQAGRHPMPAETLVAVFRAGLDRLHGLLVAEGRRLVLREHSHSRFCTAADPAARPGLREMLAPDHRLLSAMTVRHPLDSFLSLQRAGWVHFTPATMEEYARRYHAFLDAHDDLPLHRYEDFVAAPETVLAELCAQLALPFDPLATTLQAGLVLSGDSGRAGPVIEPRPRRAIPDAVAAELADSPSYGQLCTRLGYDPAP